MRAIDTNVLVRLIVADDAPQLQIVYSLLSRPFLIMPTVVMETIWVLTSVYRLPRNVAAERLRRIFGYDLAQIIDAGPVRWALARYEAGADFADMLHVALAAEAKATSFATFDRDIAKAVDDWSLTIETLA